MGVGCRKELRRISWKAVSLKALESGNIDPAAVKALSTIDIKAGEEAVTRLAGRSGGSCVHLHPGSCWLWKESLRNPSL